MNTQVQFIPERCELRHKVFTTLGEVRFRRSTQDGLPLMALNLGEREASIPLQSLRREFMITDDSHDGQMLDLVGISLDFVSTIQPGDKFPPEVLTGQASWRPSPNHLRLATTRLRLDLVSWLSPSSRWAKADRDPLSLLRLADDAGLHDEVKAVAARGAAELNLAGPTEVLMAMEELSQELSFIEALRDRFMAPVESLCRRLARLRTSHKSGTVQADTLLQVTRLGLLAFRQIRNRFEEVDAQTGEIGNLLRNVESQRSFIRSNRDWLYRSQRAWQPVLDAWEQVREDVAAEVATLLGSTYQFLAPRFMPTKEWLVKRKPRRRDEPAAQMQW